MGSWWGSAEENREPSEVSLSATQFFTAECVDDQSHQDQSTLYLDPETIQKFQIFRGDVVMVKGREGKTTPLVTMVEEGLGVNKVKLNKGIRKNIRVRPGEAVTIQGCAGLPYGKSIRVRPFADKIKEGGGADFQVLLKHYYQEAYRPAAKGDLFSLDGVEFKITETNPSPYCIVSNDTAILYDNYPLQREHNETSLEDTPTDTNI